MQGTHDIDETATAGDGDELDPREAARLLAQTEREARRQFEFSPPWITALMGAIILVSLRRAVAFDRGQHPYSGTEPRRGRAGLCRGGGRDRGVREVLPARDGRRQRTVVRQRRVEGIAILVSYLGSPMIQGAMKHYGASHAIVYGVIPAAAPLIIVGTTVLGVAASKARLATVRHRARGRHRRHRGRVRGPEWSVADCRDRPLHRRGRLCRRDRR